LRRSAGQLRRSADQLRRGVRQLRRIVPGRQRNASHAVLELIEFCFKTVQGFVKLAVKLEAEVTILASAGFGQLVPGNVARRLVRSGGHSTGVCCRHTLETIYKVAGWVKTYKVMEEGRGKSGMRSGHKARHSESGESSGG
jgi:hypothetical protein